MIPEQAAHRHGMGDYTATFVWAADDDLGGDSPRRGILDALGPNAVYVGTALADGDRWREVFQIRALADEAPSRYRAACEWLTHWATRPVDAELRPAAR